jgi:hypothetical protein
MKAPSQDFTVLSRGLFLFSGAFAFTGAQERFSHFGERLLSHAAKVVLQLAYGGERGACAWPLRFPFKNPMYPAPERTQ